MIPTVLHLASRWSRRLTVGFIALVGGLVLSVSAADFTSALSAEQQNRSGINRLTAEQQSTLNRLVGRELRAARQGGVTAFARTFIDRRSQDERHTAGLNQLTPAEQTTLNDYVAAALANQQPRPLPVSRLHKTAPPTDAKPSRLKIHGEVSLVVGGSREGSFYGGSLYTEVYDPGKKLSVGIGISTLRGHVPWWQCDAYDPWYGPAWGW